MRKVTDTSVCVFLRTHLHLSQFCVMKPSWNQLRQMWKHTFKYLLSSSSAPFCLALFAGATGSRWGVLRVNPQGSPEGALWQTGSWMRSRALGLAPLLAAGPQSVTAVLEAVQVNRRNKNKIYLYVFTSFHSYRWSRLLSCLLSDKVELMSNGTESSRGGPARQTPPPTSPSGRSPAASSGGSSPSVGQDALGPATPAEPTANATSSAEPASISSTESSTESLPAG